jgi:hypothetical protein
MPTLNHQVGASSDDARENSGAMGLTGASINSSGTNQKLGFRWTNIACPNAAPIVSAIITFYITSTANDTPNGATVGLEDTDNAATFTTGANNITNRTRTSTVAWNGANIGAGAHTVDVTSQFQTVVNRAGWVSGNAAAALVYGVSGTDVTLDTYDGLPANAAKLDIVYLTSGANPKVARVRLTARVGGVLTS